MAIENPEYYRLAGDVFIDILDQNDAVTGSTKLGNFTLHIKTASDEKLLTGLERATFGDAIAAAYMAKPKEFELKGNGLTSTVWALLFGGAVTDITDTGATVSAESHTVKSLNMGIKLAHRTPTVIAIAKSTDTAVSATLQDTGDTVTFNAHGLINGGVVFLTALATTTGVAIHVPYYVVNKTTNTFQLSLTSGGAALPLTTDGTASYRKAVAPETYSVQNASMGLIAILSGGSVAVNDVLEFYYTFPNSTVKRVSAGSKASVNVAIYGDLEDKTSGTLLEFKSPKATLTSNADVTLIGQEFMEVTLSGKFITKANEVPFTLDVIQL
jgi:hypothetical protein